MFNVLSRVEMSICLLLESAQVRESVCPAQKICEEESEKAFALPFILPGKVIQIEWLKSSSLDKNIKSKP